MAYRGTEAYDFSLFEPQVIVEPKRQVSNNNVKRKKTTGNAAPQRRAQPQKKVSNPAVKREPVAKNVIELVDSHGSSVERNAQTTAVPSAIKKSMVFFACCVLMLAVNLMLQTKYDTLSNEITAIENEIDIVEGENVRLNAELSSMISSDKIESYAENVLGMVKAENYQISYIDLSDGDEIVLSGNKDKNASEFKGKLKELMAYIF